MRRTALVLFAAILTGCGKGDGGAPQPDPLPRIPVTADDYAAAQGKWAITRIEQDGGAPLGPESFQNIEVTIAGQALEMEIKGLGAVHAAFALDAVKTPKHLDLAETDADGNARARYLPGKAGDVIAAIYKLDGDTLVVAAAARPGEPRPTEFKLPRRTPGHTASVMIVYLKRK